MTLPDLSLSPPAVQSRSGLERVEQRVKALESQLHDTEYRLRKDMLERDRVGRERLTTAMSLVIRMLNALVSDSPQSRPREDHVSEPTAALPIPDLEPRGITMQEYHAYTPEKFELLGGYLFSTADHPDDRRRLLRLLLVNVGLLEAVRLAPEESWREALQRVYG